jgi:hypothetical protein
MKLENLDNKTELNDTSFRLHGVMSVRIIYIVTDTEPRKSGPLQLNDMKRRLIHAEPISWLATVQHAYILITANAHISLVSNSRQCE